MIQRIKEEAQQLGACEKSTTATNWESLAWLFFSPQGQEFCTKKAFPTKALWQDVKRDKDLTPFGIFIDCREVQIDNAERVAFIGDTQARCFFSTPKQAHTVVLMHGASAHITATDYAVVRVIKADAESTITIDKDDTSRILW